MSAGNIQKKETHNFIWDAYISNQILADQCISGLSLPLFD